MSKIKAFLLKDPHSYENIMMWAACCMAFFGLLRSSEFTVPSQEAFDKDAHLCPGDIAIDSTTNPKLITIKIKQSKTDPYRRGVTLYLGIMKSPICPVLGILPFMAIRGNRPGPLFILKDSRMLTRQIFSSSLDKIQLQLDSNNWISYNWIASSSTLTASE